MHGELLDLEFILLEIFVVLEVMLELNFMDELIFKSRFEVSELSLEKLRFVSFFELFFTCQCTFSRFEGVSASVAVVRDHKSTKKIVVFFQAKGPHISPQEMIALSKKTLPSYMVPALVVQLDVLPKTTSAKVDLKALPPVVFDQGYLVCLFYSCSD